jgi:hypothetical protein
MRRRCEEAFASPGWPRPEGVDHSGRWSGRSRRPWESGQNSGRSGPDHTVAPARVGTRHATKPRDHSRLRSGSLGSEPKSSPITVAYPTPTPAIAWKQRLGAGGNGGPAGDSHLVVDDSARGRPPRMARSSTATDGPAGPGRSLSPAAWPWIEGSSQRWVCPGRSASLPGRQEGAGPAASFCQRPPESCGGVANLGSGQPRCMSRSAAGRVVGAGGLGNILGGEHRTPLAS